METTEMERRARKSLAIEILLVVLGVTIAVLLGASGQAFEGTILP